MKLNHEIAPIPHRFGACSRRGLLRRLVLGALALPMLGPSTILSRVVFGATEESPETEDNWEGPFYKPGAPIRSILLERGTAGTPLTVSGRVLDTQGHALKGALLDIWHADHTGKYDNQGFKLRGRIYTNAEGHYTLRTVKPLYYGEPGDMRPSHIHVKVGFKSSHVLTTQLYFNGDPWLAHDAGVRPSLILTPRKATEGLAASFDFVLKTS